MKENSKTKQPAGKKLLVLAIVILSIFIVINLFWLFSMFVPTVITVNKFNMDINEEETEVAEYNTTTDGYIYSLFLPKYLSFKTQIFISDNEPPVYNVDKKGNITDIEGEPYTTLILYITCGFVTDLVVDYDEADIYFTTSKFYIDQNADLSEKKYNESDFLTEDEYNECINTAEAFVLEHRENLLSLIECAKNFTGKTLNFA